MQTQHFFEATVGFDPDNLMESTGVLPASHGLCLLVDPQDRPILLLYGANLRRIVRRRLEPTPSDLHTKRTDLRSITAVVRYRQCWSAFESQWWYYQAVRTFYPDRYREFFPHLDAWLLHLNQQGRFPFFNVTNQYDPATGFYWGPFATRKAAAACRETIEAIFDLCRCPDKLNDPKQADRCSYAQMNRCAAVCKEHQSFTDYQKIIQQASDFMNRPIEYNLADLEQQMKQCANDRRYEQAQQIKSQLECAKVFKTETCRWVSPMQGFAILSFQTGPSIKKPDKRKKIQTLTPFILHPAQIVQLDPVPLDDIEESMPCLLDTYNRLISEMKPSDAKAAGDRLGWISHFLYSNQREKGVYFRTDRQQDSKEMTHVLRQHFTCISMEDPILDKE